MIAAISTRKAADQNGEALGLSKGGAAGVGGSNLSKPRSKRMGAQPSTAAIIAAARALLPLAASMKWLQPRYLA